MLNINQFNQEVITMRKGEMTPQQLDHRETIIQTLSVAGWNDPSVGNWFEQGLWAEFEAVMEFDNLALELSTHYHAQDDSIYFYIRNFRGGRILLIIHFDGQLQEVLKTITSFQYYISPQTYQKYIRQILRVCANTFAVVGEEGDQLVQLVHEEKEVRGYPQRPIRVPISHVPLAVRI